MTTKTKAKRAPKGKKKPAAMKRQAPAYPKGFARNHKLVDQQKGFQEYLDSLFLERPKLTLDEMLEKIKGSGFYVSRSTLARYGMEFEIRRSKMRQILAVAKELAVDDDQAVLQLEKATSQLAMSRLFEDLLDSDTVGENELAKMMTVARLQSSAASRERVRLAHNKGVKAAADKIKAELQSLLKTKHPKLLEQLIHIVDESSRKLLEAGR